MNPVAMSGMAYPEGVNNTHMHCAVVDLTTNMVINVIIADFANDPHPEGTLLVGLPEGNIVSFGWKYNADGAFTDMNPPPPVVEPTPAPQPTLADLQTQLAALTAQIQALAGQNV